MSSKDEIKDTVSDTPAAPLAVSHTPEAPAAGTLTIRSAPTLGRIETSSSSVSRLKKRYMNLSKLAATNAPLVGTDIITSITLGDKQYSIAKNSYDLLDEGKWLDDAVLGFYNAYNVAVYKNELVYVCETLFYTNIKLVANMLNGGAINSERAAEMYVRAVAKINFDTLNKVVVPVASGDHWFILLLIKQSLSTYEIYILDSINRLPTEGNYPEIQTLMNAIEQHYKSTHNDATALGYNIHQCPVAIQRNGNDCGIHMADNIETLLSIDYHATTDVNAALMQKNIYNTADVIMRSKRMVIRHVIDICRPGVFDAMASTAPIPSTNVPSPIPPSQSPTDGSNKDVGPISPKQSPSSDDSSSSFIDPTYSPVSSSDSSAVDSISTDLTVMYKESMEATAITTTARPPDLDRRMERLNVLDYLDHIPKETHFEINMILSKLKEVSVDKRLNVFVDIISARSDENLNKVVRIFDIWRNESSLLTTAIDAIKMTRTASLSVAHQYYGESYNILFADISDQIGDEMNLVMYVQSDIRAFSSLPFESMSAAETLARHWYKVRKHNENVNVTIEQIKGALVELTGSAHNAKITKELANAIVDKLKDDTTVLMHEFSCRSSKSRFNGNFVRVSAFNHDSMTPASFFSKPMREHYKHMSSIQNGTVSVFKLNDQIGVKTLVDITRNAHITNLHGVLISKEEYDAVAPTSVYCWKDENRKLYMDGSDVMKMFEVLGKGVVEVQAPHNKKARHFSYEKKECDLLFPNSGDNKYDEVIALLGVGLYIRNARDNETANCYFKRYENEWAVYSKTQIAEQRELLLDWSDKEGWSGNTKPTGTDTWTCPSCTTINEGGEKCTSCEKYRSSSSSSSHIGAGVPGTVTFSVPGTGDVGAVETDTTKTDTAKTDKVKTDKVKTGTTRTGAAKKSTGSAESVTETEDEMDVEKKSESSESPSRRSKSGREIKPPSLFLNEAEVPASTKTTGTSKRKKPTETNKDTDAEEEEEEEEEEKAVKKEEKTSKPKSKKSKTTAEAETEADDAMDVEAPAPRSITSMKAAVSYIFNTLSHRKKLNDSETKLLHEVTTFKESFSGKSKSAKPASEAKDITFEEGDESDHYTIDKVWFYKYNSEGHRVYYVTWKGYTADEATFEDISAFGDKSSLLTVPCRSKFIPEYLKDKRMQNKLQLKDTTLSGKPITTRFDAFYVVTPAPIPEAMQSKVMACDNSWIYSEYLKKNPQWRCYMCFNLWPHGDQPEPTTHYTCSHACLAQSLQLRFTMVAGESAKKIDKQFKLPLYTNMLLGTKSPSRCHVCPSLIVDDNGEYCAGNGVYLSLGQTARKGEILGYFVGSFCHPDLHGLLSVTNEKFSKCTFKELVHAAQESSKLIEAHIFEDYGPKDFPNRQQGVVVLNQGSRLSFLNHELPAPPRASPSPEPDATEATSSKQKSKSKTPKKKKDKTKKTEGNVAVEIIEKELFGYKFDNEQPVQSNVAIKNDLDKIDVVRYIQLFHHLPPTLYYIVATKDIDASKNDVELILPKLKKFTKRYFEGDEEEEEGGDDADDKDWSYSQE